MLVDPARSDRPVRARLGLAARVLLADPIRFGALGVAAGVILLVSTILTAAVLTISVAFLALVACRSALPVADRLEALPAAESA